MDTPVFVYGTLKQGFRNYPVNHGQRVGGGFETVERLPLYLVGARRLPWLVDRPGDGHHVVGELYEVDPVALARLDELEQIGRPGWYVREAIRVRPRGSSDAVIAAQVYFGDPARLETDTVHAGPIAEYTLELAQGTTTAQAEGSPDSKPSAKIVPGAGSSAT